MKIGIDARAAKWYRGTGIGTYTYQLINNLNNIDNKNEYLLFMPNSSVPDFNFSKNFKITTIDEMNSNNFWEEINLPNILTDSDIELYHVPQNGVGLPKNKICPFVITLHDVIPYRMPETVSERYLRIFNEELPKTIPLCDGIITVSNFSKYDISKAFNYPLNKIHVTYLAAEEIYRPLNKLYCQMEIKEKYHIDKKFILYVGGFSPRKNIMGLLNAYEKLSTKLKTDILLVIAGYKGKSYENYIEACEKLHIKEKVIFPGFIDMSDMPYLYNASELLVYPSLYEGFGLPPVEAMACGVPVVASNLTSIPEILSNNALLADPYNSDELYTSLYTGLFDVETRELLIEKGLLLSQKLTWQNTAISTLKAYSTIKIS